MTETEQQLEAIRINKEIGKYDKDYCVCCGKEMDIFESIPEIEEYQEVGNLCSECRDNI